MSPSYPTKRFGSLTAMWSWRRKAMHSRCTKVYSRRTRKYSTTSLLLLNLGPWRQ